MYVTRPLSEVVKSAELVAAAPEGPNAGYLVIQDQESVTYSCFGYCKNRSLKHLPFPQDKELTVRYTTSTGQSTHTSLHPLFFIPILNHPLSSNRYYAIHPHGKHKGYVCTLITTKYIYHICFICGGLDLQRSIHLLNRRRQGHLLFLSLHQRCETTAVGSAQRLPAVRDSSVRRSLQLKRRLLCKLHSIRWFSSLLLTTEGMDHLHQDSPQFQTRRRTRPRLPQLHSPVPTVVGKWYTPFMFVKELTPRDQVEQSMYYEVTLEQTWEQIFSCRKNVGNSVVIDTTVEKEQVFVGGSRATKSVVDGVTWFKVDGGGGVGLRVELVERMKWEQRRGGWMGGGVEEREVKINKVEELEGGGGWNEFGCYVLVETFNLRRMNGSLVMSYHFNHFHHLKTKWK